MAYIRVKTGPHKGTLFDIKDKVITIGRDDNQTIQILDQGVSRGHAEVFRIGEMCFVRDLESTNGTFVNDVKVSEESLKAGDELLIGTTILVFEDGPPSFRSAEDLQFEGEPGGRLETTTVELKVDDRRGGQEAKAVGREIKSRNITLINQVGRIIRCEKEPLRVFERALEIVCGSIGAQDGYVLLMDRESGKLVPRAIFEAEDSGAEKKVSRTIVNRVIQSGMPLLTSDATLDGRFALSESIILKKIKSVVCVPILIEERAEGILYFHSSKVDRGLTVEDLELAASVGLQLSLALSTAGAQERFRSGMMGTIRALVTAIETLEPKHRGHAQRVSDYSAALAQQLGLAPDAVEKVRLAGLLHDVGKVVVAHGSAGVTPEKLREEHVQAGEKVLSGIEGFEEILPGVRYHHERADGSGFPYKVKNHDTPVMARILIVTNAFDDACTEGPATAKDVVKDLAGRGGKDFDEEVIKALILCHRNGSLYGAGAPQA